METSAPTSSPRMTPPATWPMMMVAFDIGETSISSIWRPNLAPKNDETTLPYEFVMTDIMIRPGAMYCM